MSTTPLTPTDPMWKAKTITAIVGALGCLALSIQHITIPYQSTTNDMVAIMFMVFSCLFCLAIGVKSQTKFAPERPIQSWFTRSETVTK